MTDARWDLVLIGLGFAMLILGLLAEFSSGVENGLLIFGFGLVIVGSSMRSRRRRQAKKTRLGPT
ncbi:MAG: hypothetical protein ACHQAW_04455 [Actinomycetota bacterium]|jgi:hypothetical protein